MIEALDNLQLNRPAQKGLAQGRQLLASMKNMKNKPACLADFDVVMPIGKGGMGKIFMVKSKMTVSTVGITTELVLTRVSDPGEGICHEGPKSCAAAQSQAAGPSAE